MLSKGIEFYNRKDYASAQDYLYKAVTGEFKNTAIAHYYLANSLVQLRRINAALDEYQTCYSLAPYSNFSGYCREMLMKHGRNPDEKGGTASKGSDVAGSPLGKEKQSATPAITESNAITDPELSKLSARLPKLIVLSKETPSASDIMAGNKYYRASFIAEAEQRKERANEKLEQSRQALSKAEFLVHSYVPSAKSFGEADDEFRKRRDEAEKAVETLLNPFRENVKEAETNFQSESALLDSCNNAIRGY